ncbi:MAG TPA: YicC/YloC family endoribonuclease, partial [Hyphomicrobiaceae bacterium]|nr:YicC/YloC family endoribonuclease [Hyphomicrobiaceae bacterium]
TIRSMTGFARADGAAGPLSWHWEVRSVNGRGLDVRLRTPPGFEMLEQRVRDAVARRVARGSVSATLSVRRTTGEVQLRLNEAVLAQVLAALATVRKHTEAAPPRAEALLNVKGVLEVSEPEDSEGEVAERHAAMLATFDTALEAMVRARTEEGSRLETIVREQLAAIEKLAATIAASPARSPEAIRRRLKEQMARLLETEAPLDEARLYQEAAMLATRADVEEELKRTAAHVQGARKLLESDEPVGRRFDFLAQEFNREANTLCSKSFDPDIVRMGLELKAVIDQMREQVQNIE